MALAWRMYAEDNRGHLIYCAEDSGENASTKYSWVHGVMDFNPANTANWDTNVNMVNSPFFPYTGRNPAIYKCPSEKSTIVASGVVRPRVRSMTMNVYCGGFAPIGAAAYTIYHYLNEINGGLPSPGPARLWIFMDDRSDSSGFGNFLTDMSGYPNNPTQYRLSDWPSFYHGGRCTLSFADGHGELHRWSDARTMPPLGSGPPSGSIPTPRNVDIAWLQDHSTRPK